MHAVRTATRRRVVDGHRGMAGRAFDHDAGVALDFFVAHIVIAMGGGKFGVGRTMAGGALQPAMSGGKAVQRNTRERRVGWGGKCLIHRDAFHPKIGVRKTTRVANLTVIAGGGAGVTLLAIGFFEPASAPGATDVAHIAVTALALHRHRTVAGDRPAHRAAQAFGRRARMTAITRLTIGGMVQSQVQHRILDVGVLGMNRGRQRRDVAVAARGQRFARMTHGAQHRFAIRNDAAIQTLRVEPLGRQR